MKVIDSFIFAGELDILEIRLKYLSPLVDKFIIVESDHTFQGNRKPYHLEDNWNRFTTFQNKIEYIQISQDPSEFNFYTVDGYDPDNGPFLMEAQCRLGLSHYNDNIDDEDMVMISDVDEIPNVDILQYIVDNRRTYPLIFSVGMDFYGFFLNNKTVSGPDTYWNGTVITTGKHWKGKTPQAIRDKRNLLMSFPNAGYHFSWMGGVPAIQNKIRSFAHVEFNKEEILDEQAILSAIEEGRDVLQRPGVRYELQSMAIFPEDLRKILEGYPHLIKK